MFPIGDSVPSRRFPLFNLLFIGITVYVFFKQLTAPDPEAFVLQYALIPASVDFARLETLYPFITSIFLHGGFLHIFSNMMFLWVFGDNVEGELHFPLYPLLYIGAGLGGGFSQYILTPDSTIPMLGASGAVAGALGAYFALFPQHKIKTLVPVFWYPAVVEISAGVMLGYWIVLQIISGFVSLPGLSTADGGVAFFAHIGGFVFGYIVAKLLRRRD